MALYASTYIYNKWGYTFVRVNKREARNYFNNGKSVFILPSTLNFEDIDAEPIALNIADVDDSTADVINAFDNILENYKKWTYNGKRITYYIQK